jgi:dehydrogenase/reductase SDR family protein 7B
MRKYNIFNGKVVWITGASSGIGEALVYQFAEYSVKIIISSNDQQGLERVKKACSNKPAAVICTPFDLSDTTDIEKIVEKKIIELGKIDYLLNIGGISQRSKITETPMWLDRKIFEINFFGTIALTKAVLPYMISRKSGHILATSSITGRFGFPLRSAYSASKQALHGFFETLFLENKNHNIRSSIIIPGRVKTQISMHALDKEGKEHGRMDDGQANGLPSHKAAKKIIRGIIKNKREILVGRGEMTLLFIRRICPWLFFRIADKINST